MKRDIFVADLEELFDIGHSKVMSMSDIPDEDKEFLESQREELAQSSMGGVDQKNGEKRHRENRRD